MRHTNLKLMAAVLLTMVLAACGGDDNGNDRARNGTAFTAFVKSVLADDAQAEPVGLNGRDLRFTDRDNPNAYDDVLQ